MKWNFLPVAGGIYDQHPDLLLQWAIVWDEKAKYEAQERKKLESKAKKK
jgi:hypothetical protein